MAEVPPRSRLCVRALEEFIARHDPDVVTAAIDRAIDDDGGIPPKLEPFVRAASRTVLSRDEW